MLGLIPDVAEGETPRPILRAYSIASPSWGEELEFYSIKVPDGPLTSRLQHLKAGDSIILRTKPVGTLVIDALLPGKRLWLISTGTGIAPFASLIRDPDVYEAFEHVVLVHTCRHAEELAYGKALVEDLRSHEFLGDMAKDALTYLPMTTRENTGNKGRITDAITSGSLYSDLGFEPFDPDTDRFMMCGSLAFNVDMQNILNEQGFIEGSNTEPGTYVIEKAFVG